MNWNTGVWYTFKDVENFNSFADYSSSNKTIAKELLSAFGSVDNIKFQIQQLRGRFAIGIITEDPEVAEKIINKLSKKANISFCMFPYESQYFKEVGATTETMEDLEKHLARMKQSLETLNAEILEFEDRIKKLKSQM